MQPNDSDYVCNDDAMIAATADTPVDVQSSSRMRLQSSNAANVATSMLTNARYYSSSVSGIRAIARHEY